MVGRNRVCGAVNGVKGVKGVKGDGAISRRKKIFPSCL
jgi:hypothetical protein